MESTNDGSIPLEDGASILPGGWKRPSVLDGRTFKFTYNNSGLFITINWDEKKILREVFIERGKSGDEEKAAYEALGRAISLALQSGVRGSALVDTLKEIKTRNPTWQTMNGKSITITSVPDAVSKVLQICSDM